MPKQFPSGLLVAVLLTASGLLWAVMFFGPLAYLSHLAGGASPFDRRDTTILDDIKARHEDRHRD